MTDVFPLADAVQDAKLTIGGAALALLFLCFLAAVVLVAGSWAIYHGVRRYRATDAKQAQAIAEQVVDPAPRDPIRDTEPGIRLDWRDECERLYAMPAYQPDDPELTAGCDRLRNAIRGEEKKGETA
ncbi:MAG: hypothetical protein HOQ07_14170 [Sinomonas sp.]|nr:hypothetical protein [Sinomonas sp.]